jgi:hypothetical protein
VHVCHARRAGRGRERAEENMPRLGPGRGLCLPSLSPSWRLPVSSTSTTPPPPKAHVSRISHSRRNPARPDSPPRFIPAARRARSRNNGAHHTYSGTSCFRRLGRCAGYGYLRIDERPYFSFVADQVRPTSASSLRRPRPHAHLAKDTFVRLPSSMNFGPRDRTC